MSLSKRNKIIIGVVSGILIIIAIVLSAVLPTMYSGVKLHIESINSVVQKVPTRDLEISVNQEGYYTIKNDATNQPFKILQLTDLHITNGSKTILQDSKALSAIANIVTQAQPDLVIITGDLLYPILALSGTSNNLKAAKTLGTLMEKLGVPWTLTYGNHDAEVGYTHSKTALSNYYESLENCLFVRGDKNIKGQGNAYIELLNNDGSLNQILFLMDSNAYAIDGYDKIHDDQVEWYGKQCQNLKAKYGDFKSLLFFHIPLEAYKIAWKEYEDNNFNDTANVQWNTDLNKETNKKQEDVCSPGSDGKMFEEILNQGVTQGVFVGHDHINNYSLKYKGIMLTYGQSIDYVAYGKSIFESDWQRGGTIITINSDNSFNIRPMLLKDIPNGITIE